MGRTSDLNERTLIALVRDGQWEIDADGRIWRVSPSNYREGEAMGREVRRVPAEWQHPKDERGRYIPLFDGKDYERSDDPRGPAEYACARGGSWIHDAHTARSAARNWVGRRVRGDLLGFRFVLRAP